MFEDATFESMGTIHTRSRNWMIATFGLNGSILAMLVAIPFIYPSALPQMFCSIPMEAPAPVEETRPMAHQALAPASHTTEIIDGRVQAPPMIPTHTWIPSAREEPGGGNLMNLGPIASLPGIGCDPFNCGAAHADVRQVVQAKPKSISSGVMEGLLINRVLPTYPVAAREMRVAGRVQLQATISREGTIENLRVVDGPALLRQSAYDAVKQWRYRPYLLNGDPVEVETTVNVDFTLN
jgi:periplasmic protein TonB